MARLLETWPLLGVRDMARSLDFYHDRLGFEVVGSAENDGQVFWARLQRGPCSIMIQRDENAKVGSMSLYFVCEDADAMDAEISARGVEIEERFTADYGMRQIEFVDPDGHRICFESRIEAPTS